MSKYQMKKSEREQLEKKAATGEEMAPGGKGVLSVDGRPPTSGFFPLLELNERKRLFEGRKKGGEARKANMTYENYQKMGKKGRKKGGEAWKANMTHEINQEMGKKGDQSRKSGGDEDDDKEGGGDDILIQGMDLYISNPVPLGMPAGRKKGGETWKANMSHEINQEMGKKDDQSRKSSGDEDDDKEGGDDILIQEMSLCTSNSVPLGMPAGRKKGGEAWKANMTHEINQEMGKKGDQSRKSGGDEDEDKEEGKDDIVMEGIWGRISNPVSFSHGKVCLFTYQEMGKSGGDEDDDKEEGGDDILIQEMSLCTSNSVPLGMPAGRKKGGEAGKANMTHEINQEMGKKGDQSRKSGGDEDEDKEEGKDDIVMEGIWGRISNPVSFSHGKVCLFTYQEMGKSGGDEDDEGMRR